MTQAQLEELDSYLVDKSYITGYTITQDDVFEFSRVKSVPAGLINLARWHRQVASYKVFSNVEVRHYSLFRTILPPFRVKSVPPPKSGLFFQH